MKRTGCGDQISRLADFASGVLREPLAVSRAADLVHNGAYDVVYAAILGQTFHGAS